MMKIVTLNIQAAIQAVHTEGALPEATHILLPELEEATEALERIDQLEQAEIGDAGTRHALRALAYWTRGDGTATIQAALAAEQAGFDVALLSSWLDPMRAKDHGNRDVATFFTKMPPRMRATWRVHHVDGTFKGTAVLIDGALLGDAWQGKCLALTCAHVCSEESSHPMAPVTPLDADLRFNPLPMIQDQSSTVKITGSLWTSPIDELDAAILELAQTPPWAAPITEFDGEVHPESRVILLGYPDGKPLAYSGEENEVLNVLGPKMQYEVGSAPGASGGPVFTLPEYGLSGIHRGKEGTPPQNHAVLLSVVMRVARQELA